MQIPEGFGTRAPGTDSCPGAATLPGDVPPAPATDAAGAPRRPEGVQADSGKDEARHRPAAARSAVVCSKGGPVKRRRPAPMRPTASQSSVAR
jgi:hypothetical protein